jgi:ABC-type phosphate transport system substrate-binding protein
MVAMAFKLSGRSLVIAVAFLAAIAVRQPLSAQAGFTADGFPRVSGSTSTQPITILAVCRLFGWTYRWSPTFDTDSPREVWPDIRDFRLTLWRLTLWPRIQHRQTHQSYVDLIEGKTDLILVARDISADERDLLDQRRVTLDARPVALDALVFIVHATNPVTNLQLENIRSIYTGTQFTWKQLGGEADRPVQPLLRNRNSGSQELFVKHVMGDRTLIATERKPLFTMNGVIDQVGRAPDDLGFSLFYYLQQMAGLAKELPPPPPIKVISVDGVMPSKSAIADGSYALREPVLVVIRRDASEMTRGLRDWMLSADGQKTIAESGYVPLAK